MHTWVIVMEANKRVLNQILMINTGAFRLFLFFFLSVLSSCTLKKLPDVSRSGVSTATRKQSPTIVYISNADSREIYVLELNRQDGSLKLIEKERVTGSVMPLAISPDRKYLYASLRSEPYSVCSFAIDPHTGKLELIKTVPLADNMAYISTDQTGHYLFGASYFGNKISVNAIGLNGAVDSIPLHVLQTGKNAHAILSDPSNRYVFVPNLGDDVILQYRFNSESGNMVPNQPGAIHIRKGAGPRHLVFDPNGHDVFGVNELDGTLNKYQLNESGLLKLESSYSVVPAGFGGKPAAADIHLRPDGRFVYVSERSSNTIAAFMINRRKSSLSLIGNYATERQPRGFNIDPEGKYLLAVGQQSNGLTVYRIDQKKGTLSKLSQLSIGKNPNWVEIIQLPSIR